VIAESVAIIRAGRAPREPQDERHATYDPLLGDAHAAIDFAAPTGTVHDLIRGCDPSPGAHTTADGRVLRLFGSTRASGATGAKPGAVLAIDPSGVTIATADGAVRCARARSDGSKAAAADVLAELGIAVGDRLGAVP